MSEPWLRGPVPGLDPILAPLIHSFQQVREDLALHTAGLTPEQIWSESHGAPPLGFHLRHIAGSVDRLCTYLQGDELSPLQRNALAHECEAGAGREQLLAEVEWSLARCEEVIRGIDPSTLRDPREVGRQRLPTTVIGLIVHIAEHTQRHLGQAIVTARILRSA